MKKNSLLKLVMVICCLAIVQFSNAQVKTCTWYCTDDVTLASGTELGDADEVQGGQLQMCNFDDNSSLRSYYEAWMRFDFTTIADSIPAGHKILYAEIKCRTSANTGNGVTAYHIFAANEWSEDELTWNKAVADFDFQNEANYNQFGSISVVDCGGTSSRPVLNVTEPVLQETGDQGDKILTIRFEPLIKDYIQDDPDLGKKWLGMYSREVTWDWDQVAWPDFNPYCPQITLWIGPEEPKVFSDIDANYGTVDSYFTYPEPYGNWLVRDYDEDSNFALAIAERPGPVNGTPGGFAIYDAESFDDFNVSFAAKSNQVDEEGVLNNKADFVFIFGYVDANNYDYILLTVDDNGGFYHADVAGDGKVLIGEEKPEPAFVDALYHNYVITRTGNNIVVTIDEVEYLNVTDDALGTVGKIGIGSYNDIVEFDDFMQGDPTPVFTALENKITDANAKITAATPDVTHPQDAINTLQSAVDAAQAIVTAATADQPTIDAAVVTLDDAITAFDASALIVIKTDLINAIAAAQDALDNSGSADPPYSQVDIDELTAAITTAQAVADNTAATQGEVNSAEEAIIAAKDHFINISGVEELTNTGFTTYPNPVVNVLTINSEIQIQEVSVINIVGQTVYNQNNLVVNIHQVDMSNFNSGIYLVSVKDQAGNITTQKMIKK